MSSNKDEHPLPEDQKEVFKTALRGLNAARVPYVIGGAFAVNHYSCVWRNTDDLDVFVTPQRRQEAMDALAKLGYDVWVKHEPWLAKATKGPYFVDIIYGMGNWIAPVDDIWIDGATRGTLLDEPVLFAPPEELIWAKAFIATRERYDGGDVNHIIQGTKGNLDWQHIVERFGEHWEVLLATLILFLYVYPSHRDYVLRWVLHDLIARLQRSIVEPGTPGKLCRGPILDGVGTYSLDVDKFGYRDARQEILEKTRAQQTRSTRMMASLKRTWHRRS